MELTLLALHNFLSFVFIISIIVFVHEFGHFYIARLCKVKIETFSIGFGKEIFGYSDKKGTRWKFSLIPFGGYVKMHGDKNAASVADLSAIAKMSDEEKKQSFVCKNVYQKFMIVAAGPLANFILSIFLLTFLFKINGLNIALPIIDEISANSAAYEANLKPQDKIIAINDKEIKNLTDLQKIIALNANNKLQITIERENKIFTTTITPKYQVNKNIFGEEIKTGMIGISSSSILHQNLNFIEAAKNGAIETYSISKEILQSISELVIGKRSINELSGPIKIAKYSGKTTKMGAEIIIWFIAIISINLGVANLLPIPNLDGGHLFFYAIEIVLGKPIPQKIQLILFQIGGALLLSLMIFTIINDFWNWQ